VLTEEMTRAIVSERRRETERALRHRRLATRRRTGTGIMGAIRAASDIATALLPPYR
jgi:hypothetical protein